jgi:hypothetical protein
MTDIAMYGMDVARGNHEHAWPCYTESGWFDEARIPSLTVRIPLMLNV